NDGKNNSIFRDMTTVANDHFLHFFQTSFVDQHAANRGLSCNLCPTRTESNDIARFCDNDLVANDTRFFHDLRVSMQLPVCPVNRNEIARLHQSGDELQLLFAGMPADMYGRLAAVGVIDFGVPAVKMIHHPPDGPLIPRNMTGRKDDGITFLDLKILVVIQCESRKSRHRLALTTSRDNTDSVARIISNIFGTNNQTGRHVQETKLFGGLGVLRHPPSQKADETAVLLGLIDDQLKPRNRRCEARQNNAATRCSEDRFESIID